MAERQFEKKQDIVKKATGGETSPIVKKATGGETSPAVKKATGGETSPVVKRTFKKKEKPPAPPKEKPPAPPEPEQQEESSFLDVLDEAGQVRAFPDTVLSGHNTIMERSEAMFKRAEKGSYSPGDFEFFRQAQETMKYAENREEGADMTWGEAFSQGLTVLGERSLRAWQELTTPDREKADLLVPAEVEGAIADFAANYLPRFTGIFVGAAAFALGAPAIASAAVGFGSGFAGLYLFNLINTFNVDEQGVTDLSEAKEHIFVDMFGIDDEEKFDGYDPARFLRALQLTVNMAAEDLVIGKGIGTIFKLLTKGGGAAAAHLKSTKGLGKSALAGDAASLGVSGAAATAADGFPSFKKSFDIDQWFPLEESSSVVDKAAQVSRLITKSKILSEARSIKRTIDLDDDIMDGITTRLQARGVTPQPPKPKAKKIDVTDSEQVRRAASEADYGRKVAAVIKNASDKNVEDALSAGVFYTDDLRHTRTFKRGDDLEKHAKMTGEAKKKPYGETIGIGTDATGSSHVADVKAYDALLKKTSELRNAGGSPELVAKMDDLLDMQKVQMNLKNIARGGDLYEIKNQQNIMQELNNMRSQEAISRARATEAASKGQNISKKWHERKATLYKTRADVIHNAIVNPEFTPKGWAKVRQQGAFLEKLVGKSIYEDMLKGGALIKSIKAFFATGVFDNMQRNLRVGGSTQFLFEIGQSKDFLVETSKAIVNPRGREALLRKYGAFFTDGKINLRQQSVAVPDVELASTKNVALNVILGFNTAALSAVDEFGGQLFHAGITHNAVMKIVREEILESGGEIATQAQAIKHIEKILGDPENISPRILEKLEKALHLNHNELAFRAAKSASEVDSYLAKIGWHLTSLVDTAIPYSSVKALIAPFSRVNANIMDYVASNTILGSLGSQGVKVTKKQLKGTAAAYIFYLAADKSLDLTVSDADQTYMARRMGSYNSVIIPGVGETEISALGGLGESFLKMRALWDMGQMFYENPEDLDAVESISHGLSNFISQVAMHPILDQRNLEILLGGSFTGPKNPELAGRAMIGLSRGIPGGAFAGRLAQGLTGQRSANRNPWGAANEAIHDWLEGINPELYDSLKEVLPDFFVPDTSQGMYDHFGVAHESGERPEFGKMADPLDKKSHVTVFLNPNSRGGSAKMRRKIYKYFMKTRAFMAREGAAQIGDEFYSHGDFMWNKVPEELNKRVTLPKSSVSIENRRLRLNANEMMVRNSLISGDLDVIEAFLDKQRRLADRALIKYDGEDPAIVAHIEGLKRQINLFLSQARNTKRSQKGAKNTVETLYEMINMPKYKGPGVEASVEAYRNHLRNGFGINVSYQDAREMVRRNHVVSVYNSSVALANDLIKLAPSLQLRAFLDVDDTFTERL